MRAWLYRLRLKRQARADDRRPIGTVRSDGYVWGWAPPAEGEVRNWYPPEVAR